MVVLSFELDKSGIEVLGDVGKDGFKFVKHGGGENVAAIFGDKDQMNMEQKDTMAAMPDFRVSALFNGF